MQMMRAMCRPCEYIFDLVAIPGIAHRVADAAMTRSSHCPLCYRGGTLMAEPRPLTPDEVTRKQRALEEHSKRASAEVSA